MWKQNCPTNKMLASVTDTLCLLVYTVKLSYWISGRWGWSYGEDPTQLEKE